MPMCYRTRRDGQVSLSYLSYLMYHFSLNHIKTFLPAVSHSHFTQKFFTSSFCLGNIFVLFFRPGSEMTLI